MGLTNAPKTFQQAMMNIFGKLSYVIIYLDDLLVHSSDIENHKTHLGEVKTLIKRHNVTINLEKGEF